MTTFFSDGMLVVAAIRILKSAINLNEQNDASALRAISHASSLSNKTIFLKLSGFQPNGYMNHDDQESLPSKSPPSTRITSLGTFRIFENKISFFVSSSDDPNHDVSHRGS
jgi:hypothetical protein